MSTEVHNERLHHPFSPSTLNTRAASPCYKPRGGTSEAAEAGTKQHDATENEDHQNPLLSDDQSEAVAECIAIVEAELEKLGPGATAEKEGYWPIDDVKFRHGGREWVGTTAGYSDVTLFSAPRRAADASEDEFFVQDVHVIDWKFGQWSVEPAETNLQGWAYVLGVVHRQAKRGIRVKTARVTFHCPHIDETTTHLFTEADFENMLAKVRSVVAISRAADERWDELKNGTGTAVSRLVRPTTSSCLFCGRIAGCPVVTRMAMDISAKYKPLVLPPDVTGLVNPTNQQAAQGLALSAAMKEWSSAYRKTMTSRSFEEDGFMPDGYKLVVTTPRKVVNPKGFYELLVQKFGAAQAESWIDVPFSPVEEYIESQAARGQKSKAVQAFADELKAVGITTEGTPVVSLRIGGSAK